MNAKAKSRTKTNAHAAHQNVDAIAGGAHDAVDWAANATNNATDSLSHTGREMKASQEKWLAAARGYVQDNPAASVGIAAASGYLLARIFRAR